MPSDSGILELSWGSFALAFLLLLAPLFVFRLTGLKLNRVLLVGVARMVLQLAGLGLVLELLFRWNTFSLNILWLLVMQLTAAHTILSRAGRIPKGLSWRIAAVLILVSALVLGFALLLVVRPDPLYDAQYMIPLGGMILGNSMNGCTLALERYLKQMQSAEGRRTWETLLSLGAEPATARRMATRDAMQSAMLPILNSTATLGLVSIPGMMTGQILGGSPPATAILYQMLIMLAIIASVSLAAWGGLRVTHGLLVDRTGILKKLPD